MNFSEYLKSRFDALSIDLQSDSYSLTKHADILAVQHLVLISRAVLYIIAYPKVLIQFLLVKVGLMKLPVTVQATPKV